MAYRNLNEKQLLLLCFATAVLLARIFPPKWSLMPLVVAIFVRRPSMGAKGDNAQYLLPKRDIANYILVIFIIIFHNSMLFLIFVNLLGIGCAARYVFVIPFLPFYYMTKYRHIDHCSLHRWSLNRFAIRYLWDPPLMVSCFLFKYLFDSRLLHDGKPNEKTLRYRCSNPESGFFTQIDDTLLLSSFPFQSDVEYLHKHMNLKAVINLCAEYQGPTDTYRQLGIEHLHLPTLDGTPPSTESVKSALGLIVKYRQSPNNARVLVHCKGGRGRAASVCICYMIQSELAQSASEAFKILAEKRPVVEAGVLQYDFLFRHYCNKNLDE